ncbi:hypothetical protein MBLNU230_g6239t1 [Neophaeotheca triangularis]
MNLTPATKRPLIMFIYGGGFAAGSMHQFTPFARLLVRLLVRLYECVVVTTSYRHAPEHRFPTPWLNTWDALLHAQPRRPSTPTSHPNAELPHSFLGNRELLAFEDLSQWDNASPLRSPLVPELSNAVPHPSLIDPEGQKSWPPPAFVQVSGLDPLSDDGLVYAAMLEEAGTAVRCKISSGAPHGHFFWWPGTEREVAEGVVVEAIEGVGWLLGREVEREKMKELLRG